MGHAHVESRNGGGRTGPASCPSETPSGRPCTAHLLLNSHDPRGTQTNLGIQWLLAEIPLDLIPEFQIQAAAFATVQHLMLFVTNNRKYTL